MESVVGFYFTDFSTWKTVLYILYQDLYQYISSFYEYKSMQYNYFKRGERMKDMHISSLSRHQETTLCAVCEI